MFKKETRTFKRGPTFYIDENNIYKIRDGVTLNVPLWADSNFGLAAYLVAYYKHYLNKRGDGIAIAKTWLHKRNGYAKWRIELYFFLNKVRNILLFRK